MLNHEGIEIDRNANGVSLLYFGLSLKEELPKLNALLWLIKNDSNYIRSYSETERENIKKEVIERSKCLAAIVNKN